MSFAVYLDPSGGYGPAPSALRLAPLAYRSSVQGGPVWAEVSVHGPEDALWSALDWLRRPLEIRDPSGAAVWWGLVNEVRIQINGMTIGLSLEEMATRVAVASYNAAGAAVTLWSEDAAFVARYGYKELLYSMGAGDQLAANAKLVELLNNYAEPNATLSLQQRSAPPSALLSCIGWWETLSWRYFQRLEGRIEWDGGDGDTYDQVLGWGVTSTQIGLSAVGGAAILDDLGVRLAPLGTGDQIVVSGATNAGNNKTLTVVRRASGTSQTIISNTNISFNPADDIVATTAILGAIRNEQYLLVAGSVGNSRYHLIETAGDSAIATVEGVTGNIVAESAGPLITMTQGHAISVAENVVTEAPGANVTLRMLAQEIAQAFTPTHSFTVDKFAVTAGKVGTPAGGLEIRIWSDSGGNPSTQLLTVTLAAATLDDSMSVRWADPAGSVTLVAGTQYWISTRPTGGTNPASYFVVETVQAAYSGACKIWNGSAWVVHPAGVSLPFRVWGAEDNLAQLVRIVADKGQFLTGTDLRLTAAGIATNQYRDNDLTALAEAQKLLGQGDSSGRRIMVSVTPERVARIAPEPTPGALLNRINKGAIRHALGGPYPRGWLPVGEWLSIDNLPASVNNRLGLSPRFVDEAEYNVKSDELTLRFKARRRNGVQQG
jgi:hypothetical protein